MRAPETLPTYVDLGTVHSYWLSTGQSFSPELYTRHAHTHTHTYTERDVERCEDLGNNGINAY